VLRLMTSSYFVGACTGSLAGFLAFENAINVGSRTPIWFEPIRPIGDQAAADRKIWASKMVHSRQDASFPTADILACHPLVVSRNVLIAKGDLSLSRT